MSRCLNLPTLDIDFCAPGKMSFDTPGGGISGGQNGYSESVTIAFSGGPNLIGSYVECQAFEPEQHEYLNMIAARCNGGYRYINVPIISDYMGPFGALGPIVSGIAHSDGSLFSDGAGYSQATVFGVFAEAAALNAGQIVVDIVGASRTLRYSDWMSVYHATAKGWRVFRHWDHSDPEDVTTEVDGVEYDAKRYTLSIDIPLREAVTAGTRIELARPKCVMKFADRFTLAYEPEEAFVWKPTLKFAEAF